MGSANEHIGAQAKTSFFIRRIFFCSRHGRLRDSAQDPVWESFVLSGQIHCTGGSDQAWIGIGTLASGGIHSATHRTVARRRPTIGQTRRQRAYIC
jgi:hypothetical protein